MMKRLSWVSIVVWTLLLVLSSTDAALGCRLFSAWKTRRALRQCCHYRVCVPAQSTCQTPVQKTPVQKGDQPAPEVKPAEAAPKPAEAAPKAAKPTPEPAKPATKPTKPAPEPAKATPDPAKVIPEPPKPTPKPPKPAAEPAKPVPEPPKAAAEAAKSVPEPAKPANPAPKPAEAAKLEDPPAVSKP